MDNLVERARAITRPILSVMFGGTFCLMVLYGADPPTEFTAMVGIIVIEWCGERAIRHVMKRRAVDE